MIAGARCSVCFGVPHVLGIHMLACAQCLVCFMKAYILFLRLVRYASARNLLVTGRGLSGFNTAVMKCSFTT